MEELFSLMTLQTYPCNNVSIFEMEEGHLQELLLETGKADFSDSDKRH
jgi:hypothetical protein